MQRIERTRCGLNTFGGNPKVLGSRLNVRVAEQHLYGAEIGARLQHVRRAGVAAIPGPE